MIKTGTTVGGRYEILEKIGAGGMSDVYKAKDYKLNRFVAIKVLKQEFSENANFVARFSTEAQAAACLMHPNIVTVYDVGEENGIYYIVMELVEGVTLKKYIEKKARLSVKESVSIAIGVSLGIEAAHNKHIIHRDIKPQNIIISKEGKVKVTDFGIAKAATSNTVTSNVMGSVHYTSPEQARGGYSDEKSDIYSLGITIFEMLTGRVPFNGDTTVAIAIKHIQEEMPSPRDFVPEIPASVERIVAKCCQKSPGRRYQSMAELVDDLKQALVNPDDPGIAEENQGEDGPTRTITEEDIDQLNHMTGDNVYGGYGSGSSSGANKSGSKMGGKKSSSKGQKHKNEFDDDDYDPRKERITTILLILAAIVLGMAMILAAGSMFGVLSFKGNDKEETETVETTEYVTMIDVAGKSVNDAKKRLEALGIKTTVTYVEASAYESGIVISTSVEAGTVIESGSTVILTVSTGEDLRVVPDVTDKEYEDAKLELEKAGFLVNKTESTSTTVKANGVISQSPESGTTAPRGSNVTLIVSTGASDAKSRVPNLIGCLEEDAIAKLVENGLSVGKIKEVASTDFPEGQVCWQSVSEGSYLDADSTVDINVSTGAAPVTYKYNASIVGPTAQEDPHYKSGTQVAVVLLADGDQTPLLDTTTSNFPISVNFSGIKYATGTLTFTYTNVTETVTTTDPTTGQTTTVEGTSEAKVVTRPIVFTQE